MLLRYGRAMGPTSGVYRVVEDFQYKDLGIGNLASKEH